MKPVKCIEDAILVLAYWGRYMRGDLGRQIKQCAHLVMNMRDELELTRNRCSALAVALEKAETRSCDGGPRP